MLSLSHLDWLPCNSLSVSPRKSNIQAIAHSADKMFWLGFRLSLLDCESAYYAPTVNVAHRLQLLPQISMP